LMRTEIAALFNIEFSSLISIRFMDKRMKRNKT
jgi:hypothetical protein